MAKGNNKKDNEENNVFCYLQVSCKMLHVSSGAEMATKARELANHFETQETPVMIGRCVTLEKK